MSKNVAPYRVKTFAVLLCLSILIGCGKASKEVQAGISLASHTAKERATSFSIVAIGYNEAGPFCKLGVRDGRKKEVVEAAVVKHFGNLLTMSSQLEDFVGALGDLNKMRVADKKAFIATYENFEFYASKWPEMAEMLNPPETSTPQQWDAFVRDHGAGLTKTASVLFAVIEAGKFREAVEKAKKE